MNPSAPTPVFVIGSINTDMVVKAEKLPRPGETVLGGDFMMTAGGKGGNQAVAAARLGARVSMVANLGRDVFGDQAIARLQAENIDCQYINRDANAPSGVALISVDSSGENQIVVAPGANNTLQTSHLDRCLDFLPESALLLLQLEIPLATVEYAVTIAAEKKCRIILDPAPAQIIPESLLEKLYLLTPNETEAEILTGIKVADKNSAQQAAECLLQTGVQNVAVTLASQGVLLANAAGSEVFQAPRVKAIDSTAAGDCFNGALASVLARGLGLAEAIQFACRAAAISVTRRGAQDAMPGLEELQQR